MLKIIVAGLAFVVIAVAWLVVSKCRYYKRLFSAESFRDFHRRLAKALEVAQQTAAGEPPSTADGTGFVTEYGLAVGVTASKGEDVKLAIHISLSQPGHRTTHAVGSRFGFFALAIFGNITGELTPYYTNRGIHHLHFRFPVSTIGLQDFDACLARYVREYKPIPFFYQEVIIDKAPPQGVNGPGPYCR